MSSPSIKKNAALNTIRTVMGIIFPIITFPYASRTLFPEGIGKVNFANSVVSYFAIIAGLGVFNYGIREATKIRENKLEVSKLVEEIFIINIISTVISYLLLVFFVMNVPYLKQYKLLIFISSSSIIFTTIGFDWVYNAFEEFSYITIRSISFQFISLVLLFIFVKTKDDYVKYLMIGVFSSVGYNIFNFFHLRKYIKFSFHYKLDIKKHLKPIFMLFGLAVITSIYTILDTTMLGFLAGDEQVGYYSAATKINKMVLSIVTAASAVIFPRLSKYANDNDNSSFRELFNLSLNITLCFAIPVTIGLNLLSEPITLLFSGYSYLPSIPVMRIMNPIIVIISISNLIGIQCLVPLKKEKITLISVFCGAITNFTLNFFLIQRYQAVGAAIATVVAESVVLLVQLLFAYKQIDKKIFINNLFQVLISVTIMGIVVLLITKLYNEPRN
jgi:O-antigen/teichoic acid export membrane protein